MARAASEGGDDAEEEEAFELKVLRWGPQAHGDQVSALPSAAWKFTARPGTTVEMACL